MLSQKENEMLTRVGPGTPMGELMRRYWIPAAFSHQIAAPDCPPVRVRLMGENLVLFRDTQGRVGLIDERCPHRTASMFFGRNEESGLRCVYHGLKFDVAGNCVDVPCVPQASEVQKRNLLSQLKIKAYPCLERGDVVWAYMGPPRHKPEFPELEWTRVPKAQRFVTRHVQECNWLQGLEGGFDPTHLSFLHRGDAEKNRNIVVTLYEVVPTDFGFVVGTGRDPGQGDILWNVNVMLMPFHKILSTENIPGTDHAVRNKHNDYLIDRVQQASGASYTGMKGLGTQDCAIQESMGPIADRSAEHLLACDAAIVKIRRLLLQTLQDHAAGKPVPGMRPESYRVRSTRYEAPRGAPFAAIMNERVRIDVPVAAK